MPSNMQYFATFVICHVRMKCFEHQLCCILQYLTSDWLFLHSSIKITLHLYKIHVIDILCYLHRHLPITNFFVSTQYISWCQLCSFSQRGSLCTINHFGTQILQHIFLVYFSYSSCFITYNHIINNAL